MAKSKKNLCGVCTGLCCRYVALPLDTPEDRNDYEDIRWYLCHENMSVFVEEGAWYVNIMNKCRHLSEEDYKCGIYEKRPRICRAYDNGECDLAEGEYDYELYFTDDKQMDEYIKVKFDNKVKDKKSAMSKKRKK